MIQRAGRATWLFQQQPSVIGYASVVGKKETEGPLGEGFDRVIPDSYNGCDTYEEAEARMQRSALRLAAAKCNLEAKDIDCVFAGDLLNQCIGSSFGLKNLGIPYLGQYAACATMAQSLMTAAMMVESGAVKTAACVTSSHFCAAERQYRFPLEYGSVRTPTAQWTVTGAGGCVLQRASEPLRVAAATVGKITDLEMTDPNNMGAAMAPAAAETILRFFSDTGSAPDEYDRVFRRRFWLRLLRFGALFRNLQQPARRKVQKYPLCRHGSAAQHDLSPAEQNDPGDSPSRKLPRGVRASATPALCFLQRILQLFASCHFELAAGEFATANSRELPFGHCSE